MHWRTVRVNNVNEGLGFSYFRKRQRTTANHGEYWKNIKWCPEEDSNLHALQR